MYPPLQDMYYDGILKRKAILKFTAYDGDTQKWIYETFKDQITDAKANALKKSMTRDAIASVFKGEEKAVKKLTVEVPEGRVEEFREMFDKWLEEVAKAE